MPAEPSAVQAYIDNFWDQSITPSLIDYIRIPNVSVDFDPDWEAHGYMQQANRLALDWLAQHMLPDWKLHTESIPGKSPLILVEIPGASEETVLLYGHLDKQPEMEGWWDGFGAWQPILKDAKLYGRGGADDGYALFASIAAIRALQAQQQPHARIIVLIEFSEESGSPDLPEYLQKYQAIIGTPNLVIALDSGAGDYERLWSTTSLRGMLSCTLSVEVLTEATHSGIASGIIPSSMRIMRQLLDRLEDSKTGQLKLDCCYADIPAQRQQQAVTSANILGDQVWQSFNRVDEALPVTLDPATLILNNTWRPSLCVVGQAGMPNIQSAGNVLRAYTQFKLSFRLPPTIQYTTVQPVIEQTLRLDPPYNAKVDVCFDQGGNGWDAPPLSDWLAQATQLASETFYGNIPAYSGLGGSIPFMAMLGARYPDAEFLITGVLGPKSNAHGPNEFLHIPYAKKLTACIAMVLEQHLNHIRAS